MRPLNALPAVSKLVSMTPGLALRGSGVRPGVDVDRFGLPDSMQATHALFEPNQRPGDIPVNHHVRGLQVDALAACIG